MSEMEKSAKKSEIKKSISSMMDAEDSLFQLVENIAFVRDMYGSADESVLQSWYDWANEIAMYVQSSLDREYSASTKKSKLKKVGFAEDLSDDKYNFNNMPSKDKAREIATQIADEVKIRWPGMEVVYQNEGLPYNATVRIFGSDQYGELHYNPNDEYDNGLNFFHCNVQVGAPIIDKGGYDWYDPEQMRIEVDDKIFTDVREVIRYIDGEIGRWEASKPDMMMASTKKSISKYVDEIRNRTYNQIGKVRKS